MLLNAKGSGTYKLPICFRELTKDTTAHFSSNFSPPLPKCKDPTLYGTSIPLTLQVSVAAMLVLLVAEN